MKIFRYFALLAIMLPSFAGHAQNLIFPGNFEFTGASPGTCVPMNSVGVASPGIMVTFTQAEPLICDAAIYPSNINGGGNKICVVTNTLDEANPVTQNLRIPAGNLSNTSNSQMILRFDYINLGAAEGMDEASASILVTCGELSYRVALSPAEEFSGWARVSITLCGAAGDVFITPQIESQSPNASVQIGFDNFNIDKGATCTCSCNSFQLVPNQKYLVSGWVKCPYVEATTYTNVSMTLDIYDSTNASLFPNADPNGYSGLNFAPSGDIIDGWQKITGEFTVPNDYQEIVVLFNNNTDDDAFFDDIRLQPYDSSLKSFVYDQASQKLMAELDENNYATFYEYDAEGGLIRVKKETEKGVFTIQETRSSNRKDGE